MTRRKDPKSRKAQKQGLLARFLSDPRGKALIGFVAVLCTVIGFLIYQWAWVTITIPESMVPNGCPTEVRYLRGYPIFEPALSDPQWREAYPTMGIGDHVPLGSQMYPCLIVGEFTSVSGNAGLVTQNEALTDGSLPALIENIQIILVDGYSYGYVYKVSDPTRDQGHAVIIEWYNQPRKMR